MIEFIYTVILIISCEGSLLLLVKNYADSPEKVFITDTALGVLLLLFAALLAYAGTVQYVLNVTTLL